LKDVALVAPIGRLVLVPRQVVHGAILLRAAQTADSADRPPMSRRNRTASMATWREALQVTPIWRSAPTMHPLSQAWSLYVQYRSERRWELPRANLGRTLCRRRLRWLERRELMDGSSA
jgi:hypothetical protein